MNFMMMSFDEFLHLFVEGNFLAARNLPHSVFCVLVSGKRNQSNPMEITQQNGVANYLWPSKTQILRGPFHTQTTRSNPNFLHVANPRENTKLVLRRVESGKGFQ